MSDSELHESGTSGNDSRSDSVSTLVAPDVLPSQTPPVAGGSSGNIHEVALPTDKTVISKRLTSTDAIPPVPATSQSLGAALVGKKFGNYELAEFVGGGGMGAVFRATDTSMGRTVAVKVLSRDQTDEETIRRFRNEAHSAARLDHPNIARAYYVGEHEGWNYIVFEYVQGINLRDLVEKNGPLPIEQALNYTLQVAQALDHAAGRDVVHRDIKPSNVLVTPAGEIKLVDMGLARLHQVQSSSDDLTASGVTLGTFDYISPEQARDPRIADSRSDIYSLGCTLYFMLAGRPPFPDGTALQKLLWHSGEDPPDPRLFRPELPTRVIRLLEKMLAKRPAQRPQSPRELIAEIAAVADEIGLAGFGAGQMVAFAPPAGPPAWSRALGIVVPVAALVLLVMVVGSWRPSDTGMVSLRPKLKEPPPVIEKTSSVSGGKTDSSKAVTPAAATSKEGPRPASTSPEPSGSGVSAVPGMPTMGEEPLISPASTTVPKNGSPSTESPAEAVASPAGSPVKPLEAGAALVAAPPLEPAELRAEPAESAVLTSSTIPPATTARPKITRLVVRPDGTSPPALAPDHSVVKSFARACQLAAELGIQDIELQFNGEVFEKPLDLGVARLTVHPAAGHKPILVFRPLRVDPENDRQMIRVKCGSTGKITFQGIELRMELPLESASGWSLFSIYQMQQLDLVDCVLTVKDVGTAGLPMQQQVAFFTLQPRRIADAMKMMENDMAMVPAMGIGLTRSVARGDATFLRISEESPLKITWTQGLFVTTQRLVDTEGSPLRPTEFGRLDIDLDKVTAIVPQGLYAMRRKAANPYQLKVDINCKNSLVQTGAEAPLFEFWDMAALDDVNLRYRGDGNLYEPKRAFLRFHPSSRGEPTVEYKQDAGLPNIGARLSLEDRSSVGIQWLSTPSEGAVAHRQLPRNFVLDPDSRKQAGFDPGELPEPADAVKPVEDSPDDF